jgi:hypothetical protein
MISGMHAPRCKQTMSALAPILISVRVAGSLGPVAGMRLLRRIGGRSAQSNPGLMLLLLLALGAGAAASEAIDGGTAAMNAASSEAPRAAALPTELPVGAIIAFMPQFGSQYRDSAGLRRWLGDHGWAICDGTRGTPDLRNRLLLGTTDMARVGRRIGSRDHDHRIRGESGSPVRRNRSTPTGRLQLRQIPDDQHRHGIDLTSAKAEHLPPSLQVLFIMKLR